MDFEDIVINSNYVRTFLDSGYTQLYWHVLKDSINIRIMAENFLLVYCKWTQLICDFRLWERSGLNMPLVQANEWPRDAVHRRFARLLSWDEMRLLCPRPWRISHLAVRRFIHLRPWMGNKPTPGLIVCLNLPLPDSYAFVPLPLGLPLARSFITLSGPFIFFIITRWGHQMDKRLSLVAESWRVKRYWWFKVVDPRITFPALSN